MGQRPLTKVGPLVDWKVGSDGKLRDSVALHPLCADNAVLLVPPLHVLASISNRLSGSRGGLKGPQRLLKQGDTISNETSEIHAMAVSRSGARAAVAIVAATTVTIVAEAAEAGAAAAAIGAVVVVVADAAVVAVAVAAVVALDEQERRSRRAGRAGQQGTHDVQGSRARATCGAARRAVRGSRAQGTRKAAGRAGRGAAGRAGQQGAWGAWVVERAGSRARGVRKAAGRAWRLGQQGAHDARGSRAAASTEGDYYLCVLPDPSIEAAPLGASESTLPSTALAEALHTFTLDSGASRCFFRDSTTLTPLSAPVPVRLANPSGGQVLVRSTTVLPCLAVLSGSLLDLHLPSFSMNLVSTAALQDAMVTTTTPGGQRVSICTCTRTGRHLASFTRPPGSSLYTLATEPPQVAASAQVSVSGQVAPPCSCRLLSHQTLLWHHRLGHPSLPRLCGMHSRLLVSGLPRSLPPLPPSPAPPCLPCIKGRLRAAPYSYSFPPTTAPLQTLYIDVWGPSRVNGQGRERYFLLVVDDYTRYTTVFPLPSKGEVPDVLIPWIREVGLQLRERFREDILVLRLHSDRGGEFSSDLLRDFCRGVGILQSFTLPPSPQQNGIAERHIGLVMEVARTSIIHAAAHPFLWPFAVRYATH
ncbi:unnamed protein product [Closterium sp. NIES-53]